MHHPELPVVSFLCIPLLFCSLPSHIRAGSVATISLIAWLTVMSLIRGVNAIVWANNIVIRLEVWCDITTKITVGFTYAVPASALCILRHLESVSSTRNARSTKADKRWRQKFEAAMCFGLPMIGMTLHYVVQGHRLDLIEDFGCYPPVYFSVAAIMILWVPPLVMSLITFTYAALALRHFLRHRIEFAAHLQNSQSSITPTRYYRLMALAVFEMVWDTGINAYLIYFNSFAGLLPWTTWDDVHSNFSRVAIFPAFLIPPQLTTQLIWQWWIVPISCIAFFIFFGLGEEAMSDYRAAIVWFRRTILRHQVEIPPPYGNPLTLPTHIRRPTNSYNANISSSTNSNASGNIKEWDELSLKMPEITENSSGYRPISFSAASSNKVTTFSCRDSRPISLVDSQCSPSLHSGDSLTTAVGPSNPPSPTQSLSPTPALATVPPVGRTAPFDGHKYPFVPDETQLPQAKLPDTQKEASDTLSRQSSRRRSTDSNLVSNPSPDQSHTNTLATLASHDDRLLVQDSRNPAPR